MSSFKPELVLGTAQFGMVYGIAGRGEIVSSKEVQQILQKAWTLGVRTIDTASAYGVIEEQLIDLIGGYPFVIVSKISAIPKKFNESATEDYVSTSIYTIRKRLGNLLCTLLFHQGNDLLSPYGEAAWDAAIQALAGTSIRLGVSCYSPNEVANLCTRYPIMAAQIPGNAFDQRLTITPHIEKVELHLRSVFLQGLLLLESSEVAVRLPQAAAAISRWQRWCKDREITPLEAALSIVKGFPGIRYCVVGVDKLSQLEEVSEAWANAIPLKAAELSVEDLSIIDPRSWFVMV